MNNSNKEIAKNALKAVLPGNSLTVQLLDTLGGLIKITKELSDNKSSIDELDKETSRQIFVNKMAAMQAKTNQEIAIAERIREAETVEIEEYYDLNCSAGISGKVDYDGGGASVNIGGEKISRV